MQTTLLRNWNDLQALKQPLKEMAPPTPFHGWGYLEAWMTQRPPATTPFVVLVTDQGQWAALALWSVERTPLGTRRLIGMGGDDAWYHDPWVFQPAQSERVAQALATAVRNNRTEWDLLQLALRPSVSGLLLRNLQDLGIAFADRAEWRQQQTAVLTGEWEGYWQERPKQFRELIRRRTKKLAGYEHRFFEADASNVESLLEALFKHHQERWSLERNWTGYYRLIRGMTHEALEGGRLGFFALEADDRLIALELLIRCGSQSYELMRITDPDPAFASLSAGSLLTAWAFERLHGQGVRKVDMGPGHFEWKANLEAERTETILQVIAAPTHPLALAQASWIGGIKPLLRNVPQVMQLKDTFERMKRPALNSDLAVHAP